MITSTIFLKVEMFQFMSSILKNFDNFSHEGIVNVFGFAKKIFTATASNQTLQQEVVQRLIGTASEVDLVRMSALTKSEKVMEAAADLFKLLLNSKVRLSHDSNWRKQ